MLNKTHILHLIIKIYFVAFKVVLIGGNTHMPAFFPLFETFIIGAFWDDLQFARRILFDVFNGGKTLSTKRQLEFGKQKKSHEVKSGEHGGCLMVFMDVG